MRILKNYTKNIKPAPNPHYTLEKFYGNLSIQEYRRLLKNARRDYYLEFLDPKLDENSKFLFNHIKRMKKILLVLKL